MYVYILSVKGFYLDLSVLIDSSFLYFIGTSSGSLKGIPDQQTADKVAEGCLK